MLTFTEELPRYKKKRRYRKFHFRFEQCSLRSNYFRGYTKKNWNQTHVILFFCWRSITKKKSPNKNQQIVFWPRFKLVDHIFYHIIDKSHQFFTIGNFFLFKNLMFKSQFQFFQTPFFSLKFKKMMVLPRLFGFLFVAFDCLLLADFCCSRSWRFFFFKKNFHQWFW